MGGFTAFEKLFRFRDFMTNFRETAPKWLRNSCPKKISNFKNTNILYTALKQVI